MKAEAERLQKIRRIGSAVLAVSVAAAVAVADDQAKPAPSPSAPASRMEQLYLVLLKRGAPRSAEDTPERQAIQGSGIAAAIIFWPHEHLRLRENSLGNIDFGSTGLRLERPADSRRADAISFGS